MHSKRKQQSKAPKRSNIKRSKRRTMKLEDFESIDEAVEAITGRRPSEEEKLELRWYEKLREILISVRKDAELTQTEVADTLGVVQSEISRLENSLGPGTRIGKLRDYLKVCQTELEAVIKSAPDKVYVAGAPNPDYESLPGIPFTDAVEMVQAGAVEMVQPIVDRSWRAIDVNVEGVRLRGYDLPYLAEVMSALDAAMSEVDFSIDEVNRFRHSFLECYRKMREEHRGVAIKSAALLADESA